MGRGLVVLHTPDSFLARFRVQVWSGFRRWISTVLVCVFHCLSNPTMLCETCADGTVINCCCRLFFGRKTLTQRE